MEKDISSLEHTRWRCQYHIVFAPKYRRMAIYGQIKKDIGAILRKLCEQKGVEITEAEACPDHIHMLISIPPKYSVVQIMGYLKGKSSLMIFDSRKPPAWPVVFRIQKAEEGIPPLLSFTLPSSGRRAGWPCQPQTRAAWTAPARRRSSALSPTGSRGCRTAI